MHPLPARRAVGRRRPRATRCSTRAPALHADRTAPPPLRDAIAAHVSGRDAPTTSRSPTAASEANYITTWNLVEPGDEVVMMVPNYMQTWGLARAFGATVREWPLRPADGRTAGASTSTRSDRARHAADEADRHLQSEQPDRRAVRRPRISIASPRSPSGTALDAVRRDLPRRRARRPRDADDVGPLRSRDRHERTVEGVRPAGPAHRLDRRTAVARRVAVVVSRLHDDFARARSATSSRGARSSRAPARDILARTRAHPRTRTSRHRPTGCDAHGGLFSYVPPDAGAIVYVRYHHADQLDGARQPAARRRKAC